MATTSETELHALFTNVVAKVLSFAGMADRGQAFRMFFRYLRAMIEGNVLVHNSGLRAVVDEVLKDEPAGTYVLKAPITVPGTLASLKLLTEMLDRSLAKLEIREGRMETGIGGSSIFLAQVKELGELEVSSITKSPTGACQMNFDFGANGSSFHDHAMKKLGVDVKSFIPFLAVIHRIAEVLLAYSVDAKSLSEVQKTLSGDGIKCDFNAANIEQGVGENRFLAAMSYALDADAFIIEPELDQAAFDAMVQMVKDTGFIVEQP